MKKITNPNWKRIKADTPLIFIATFAAIIANYGFNKGVLDITSTGTWILIFKMGLFSLVAIGIGYLVLYLFYFGLEE